MMQGIRTKALPVVLLVADGDATTSPQARAPAGSVAGRIAALASDGVLLLLVVFLFPVVVLLVGSAIALVLLALLGLTQMLF